MPVVPDLFLPFIGGLVLGTITGLLPGLHPNTVLFLLLPVYLATQPPAMPFIAFAAGMSVVHTFVSFIPSILLGAPDGSTALSVHPGHEYVRAGRGFEAIEMTVYGGLIAAGIAVVLLPILFVTVPILYGVIQPLLPVLLGGVLALMLVRATGWIAPLIILVLAGALGVTVLHSPAANSQYILFPLFAGVFGLATILLALIDGVSIPQQRRSYPVDVPSSMRGGLHGFLAGVIAGFLPGIGSSQSAVLVDSVSPLSRRDFLIALGGITTADLFLSLLAVHVIGNPRSGVAVAIEQVAGTLTMQHLGMIVGLVMVAVGIGAITTRVLGRPAVSVLSARRYRWLVIGVTCFVVAGTFLLTGWFGLLVLVTATALGISATLNDVPRSYCMAVLIVPTILTYLGMTPVL